jgi:hypothetical protein
MRHSWLITVVLAFPLGVLAQDAGTPTPKGSAAKPARPKPNPALTEQFHGMTGTWACSGSMESPQSPGTQIPTRSEMHISPEVDGFAYSGTSKMEKNAAMPAGSKARLFWSWDDGKKQLIEFGFDSNGDTWRGTSDGLKGDDTVWNEEGSMMGQSVRTRTTVTRKSAKEVLILFENEDKGAWHKVGEDHCKKKG